MIPKQFERFELAGRLYIWAYPQSPLSRDDEFGTELWARSVGPRTAVTELIRDDRGIWFIAHQDDMFKHGTKTYREISEQEAASLLQESGAAMPAEALGKKSRGKKPKASTQNGDAETKLIAALTAHHRYGDSLNTEPIGNNELARQAGVDKASASAFFKKYFKGHGKYKAVCRDAKALVNALKLLNGDFAPHELATAYNEAKAKDKAEPTD